MRLAACFILLFCGVANAQTTVPGQLLTAPSASGQIYNSQGASHLWSSTATPTFGAAGTLGSLTLGNATSGLGTLQPATGALGTTNWLLPALGTTDTITTNAATQTLTNKTISGASNTITNIANAALTNSSIAIGGTSVSLGGATGAVGTPLSSLFLTAGTITGSGGNQLTLNTLAGSQASNVLYKVNGTAAFTEGVNTSGNWALVDSATGRNIIVSEPSNVLLLVPSAGVNTGVGTFTPNMLFSVANVFGADASGHPYCDVRAFGGGTGSASADNTAVTNALTTCAGGEVYFPAGTYLNHSGHWTVPGGTTVRGAGKGASTISSNLTSDDVFQCTGGTNHTLFIDLRIVGPATASATVPSSGYGINCSGGAQSERFERLNIDGTFNGIYPGGTNCVIADNRLENLMGDYMIYEPNGGCGIHDNQLDNNSEFNAISGSAVWAAYAGSSQSIATNTTVECNGYFYLAVTGGTTGGGSGCGNLSPVVPMYTNVTDGSVTWQVVGKQTLVVVQPGTETWMNSNDMTSPAAYAIVADGGLSASHVWAWKNDIGGEILGGIVWKDGSVYNQFDHNNFQDIGRVGNTTADGFPLWDQGGGNNGDTIVSYNVVQPALDAAILIQSSSDNVQGNVISGYGQATTTYCAIESFGAIIGMNVSGNNIAHSVTKPAICTDGNGSAQYTSAVGNTVYGGTITLSGTNQVSANNN